MHNLLLKSLKSPSALNFQDVLANPDLGGICVCVFLSLTTEKKAIWVKLQPAPVLFLDCLVYCWIFSIVSKLSDLFLGFSMLCVGF